MKSWVIGFPRIGEKRELKFALEKFWRGEHNFEEVQKCAVMLQQRHLTYQKEAGIDAISVGDFSLYDQTLDMVVALGVEPKSFLDIEDKTKRYFAMARGDESHTALEMTKWFNTNYHYIVPILDEAAFDNIDATHFIEQYRLAKALGITPKINLIGPLTFIANAKKSDGTDAPFEYFEPILTQYKALLKELATLNERIILQLDEPILVTDRAKELGLLLKKTYTELCEVAPNLEIYVITYFEHAKESVGVLASTPIKGIGLDFVYGKEGNMEALEAFKDSDKTLIAGIIDGRNVWIADIEQKVRLLEQIAKSIDKDRIMVGTSCSLLHLPYTLKHEQTLDTDIKSWLSFAVEKLDELRITSKLFFDKAPDEKEQRTLETNIAANRARKDSTLIFDQSVQECMKRIDELKHKRPPFEQRIKKQHARFNYPPLATTTIGSFPQTAELRALRKAYKEGNVGKEEYEAKIKEMIKECVLWQEEIGLDVLVHGEFERNDMVEYFGEQLSGVAFSQNGWVQSYGSRCVKPPIIYGDVSRKHPMTVAWSSYAQSLTQKPMKGMLTGAVTILNWSFVRDDQPRADTCYQIALAIRDEVDDLQKAGIGMIQVDEAAFKEGYPLRSDKRAGYEKFALESFWITTNVADDETQIHTHMCYSEFNDIIDTIEAMDADVISIETARSGNVLLKIFKQKGYKQEIGPGVYDIHSPRIPSVEEIEMQIEAILEVLPPRQLWINPDCGLKTRRWKEVKPSLEHMVQATFKVRKKHGIA